MEIVMIHGDNVVNGIGVYACSDVISLCWQRQIAASYPAPHIDGQMITYLITESISRARINIREAGECEILIHARHIGQGCTFR
jgi:hypothetical protein